MRLLALGLSLFVAISCNAEVYTDTGAATVAVTGEGVVSVVPDMATLTVGVVTQAGDAAGALAANNDAMADLNRVLDRFDIAERDRKTSNFSVSPRYDRNDGRSAPRIASYEVSNRVAIRYRKIDRLGELLDAVVKSGGNRIDGLVFGNTNENEHRDEARKLAVTDARHRASLYADAAGVTLGKVLSITEAGAPQPHQVMRTMAFAESAAVPISAGENEIRAVVQVVFELR